MSLSLDALELSQTELLDALADARRRFILQYLQDHASLTLADLADELATREQEAPLPAISPDTVMQGYLSLYHIHVPKLAAIGLVTYDQDQDRVALTDIGRRLDVDGRLPSPRRANLY